MGRNHKFAVGVTVALLLGAAASPALATPGNGHAYGKAPATKPAKPVHPPKPDHPAKGPKPKAVTHLNGGGTVGTTTGGTAGEFSVQVKQDKLRQGHFNFDATDVKVRCRSFPAGSVSITKGQATFTNVPCTITRAGAPAEAATLTGTFTDAGNPADTTPPTAGPDSVTLTATPTSGTGTPVTISGPVTGNIKTH